jgi:hypothetical protein
MIGNLTLLEPSKNNKDAADKSFSEKLEVYQSSKYALSTKIGGLSWTPKMIEHRQMGLAKNCLWNLEDLTPCIPFADPTLYPRPPMQNAELILIIALSWGLIWLYERADLSVLGGRPSAERLKIAAILFVVTALCCASGFWMRAYFCPRAVRCEPSNIPGANPDGYLA